MNHVYYFFLPPALVSTPYLTGNDVTYVWTVSRAGVPDQTFSSSSIMYTFEAIGSYTVAVTASNAIGSESGQITVIVQVSRFNSLCKRK